MGLFGGAGGLVASLLAGELLLHFLLPSAIGEKSATPTRVGVDIVFCIDVTNSMLPAIQGVEVGVTDFVNRLAGQGIDARLSLIRFGDPDSMPDEKVEFVGTPFASSVADFKERVQSLKGGMVHGGDPPEASWRALNLAAEAPFAPSAVKMVVLITDSPANDPSALDSSAARLKGVGVTQFHLVCRRASNDEWYGVVRREIAGESLDVAQLSAGQAELNVALPLIGRQITQTVRPFISSRVIVIKYSGQIVSAVAAWTAVIGLGIGLSLIACQNVLAGHAPLTLGQSLGSGTVMIVVGVAIGVLVSQPTLLISSDRAAVQTLLKAMLYTTFGGLIGVGVAPLIRNLTIPLAALGGATGGLLGGTAYLFAERFGGDVAGRLMGATTIGAGIGLMIAVVEQAREVAWADVCYGSLDTLRINLGPKPLALGSDGRRCDVRVKTAAPVALRLWTEPNCVMAEDVAAASSARAARDGEAFTVGRATVVVRTSAAKPAVLAGPQSGPDIGPVVTAIARGPAFQEPNAALPIAPPAKSPIQSHLIQRRADTDCVIRLVSGDRLTLTAGAVLRTGPRFRIGAKVADGAAVAELVRSPRGVLGLRNVGPLGWLVQTAGRSEQTIAPQRGVEIMAGMRVRVGEASFSVEGLPAANDPLA